MSEQRWTPGPWNQIRHEDACSRVGANTLLAVVYSTVFRDTENQAANAHLIAAAPDLYAALDAIADLWRLPECSNELVARMIREQVMGPAMTALAKARGGA